MHMCYSSSSSFNSMSNNCRQRWFRRSRDSESRWKPSPLALTHCATPTSYTLPGLRFPLCNPGQQQSLPTAPLGRFSEVIPIKCLFRCRVHCESL